MTKFLAGAFLAILTMVIPFILFFNMPLKLYTEGTTGLQQMAIVLTLWYLMVFGIFVFIVGIKKIIKE